MVGDLLGGAGGLVGNIAVLAGAAGDGGEDELKKAVQAVKKLQTSKFDFTQLSAPELRAVNRYFPQLAEGAATPELRQASDEGLGKRAQADSLAFLTGIRDQGLPLEMRAQMDQAGRSVANEFRGSQNAVLDNLQARGRLGGGTEARMRLGGGQRAMELAGDLGTQIAVQGLLRRLEAGGQAAGLATSMRGQDADLAGRNAEMANRFNLAIAQMGQQNDQFNAGARERAHFANVGTDQRISDTNELNRYDVGLENLMRKNSLLGTEFDQELAKVGALTSAYGGLAQGKYAEQAARAQSLRSLGQGLGRGVGGAVGYGQGGYGR